MAERGVRYRDKLAAILAKNWQAEMQGFHTYQALSERELDGSRREILESMARSEQEHAQLWGERLAALGVALPLYRGRPGGAADGVIARIGGSDLLLRRLEIEESRDIARYVRQLRDLGDEGSLAILERVLQDEREHHRELSRLVSGRISASGNEPAALASLTTPAVIKNPAHPASTITAAEDPRQLLTELLASRSHKGRQAADWIGDAIYGVNDGLGAIFGIVSGVSGATLGNQRFVLLAGLAGMIASALSMGSGAYLAAKSEREIYEAEVAREREAIETNPAEAHELLSLYYQVKGLPRADADRVVDHIARDPAQLLRALAAERLHATEGALRVPLRSALSGSLSTAIGAFIPIIPFFFIGGIEAVVWAAVISLLAHFGVGAAKALITVRSWWSSGLEMTLIGAAEGIVTYAIGVGLGKLGT